MLAWELPAVPDQPDVGFLASVATAAVVDDGLVLAGDLVVDVDAGRTVAGPPLGRPLGDGRSVHVEHGRLVLVDVRTGVVDRRVPLDGVPAGWRATFVSGVTASGEALVEIASGDATGRWSTVVASLDGSTRPLVDGVAARVAGLLGDVVLVERITREGGVDDQTPLLAVDVGSDEVIGEVPGDAGAVVEVSGHLVTSDDRSLRSLGRDGERSTTSVVTTTGPLTRVKPLGELGGRVLVAGVVDGVLGWSVVSLPPPPWPDDRVTDVVEVARVDPPFAPDSFELRPGAPAGIHEPGDAAVLDGAVVLVDDDGATVRAVELDGTERWRLRVDEPALVSPAGDHVLLSTGGVHTSRTSTLLTVASGERVWSERSPTPITDRRLSLVHDGAVHVEDSGTIGLWLDGATGELGPPPPPLRSAAVGSAPLAVVADPGGSEGADAALLSLVREGAATPVWTIHVDESPLTEIASVPDGSVQIVAFADLVTALETVQFSDGEFTAHTMLVQPSGRRIELDGELVWRSGLYGPIVRGAVVLRRDDGASLVDPRTGAALVEVDGATDLAPSGADRLVALSAGRWWVADSRDGQPVGARPDVVADEIAVGDGVVATSSPDGTLQLVDATDGVAVWSVEGAPVAPSVLALAGDHVLLGTRDGRILQHGEDGELVGELDVGEGAVEDLAWVAGTLVVVVDGAVRGYRADGTGITTGDEVVVP